MVFNHNTFSRVAGTETGQYLIDIRSFDYLFNSSIACSCFLDPTDKIAAGESVDVTLALTEQVSSLKNQDSEPLIQAGSLTPVPEHRKPYRHGYSNMRHF